MMKKVMNSYTNVGREINKVLSDKASKHSHTATMLMYGRPGVGKSDEAKELVKAIRSNKLNG